MILARHDDGEFVVLETSELRSGRQIGLQPLGNGLHQRVAAAASLRIVDLAKAVEIDQRQNHNAGPALFQRVMEFLEHDPVIGQSGQRILAREPADGAKIDGERASEPQYQTRGEKSAQSERGAEPAHDAPQPGQVDKQRPVGRPTEPADDAALRVVQRLHLAAGNTGIVAVETQILQTGAAGDSCKLAGVEMVVLASRALQFVERKLQRGMPLGSKMIILAQRDRQAGDGACQHRHRQGHQHVRGDM